MRCSCRMCDTYMVHGESQPGCVCPNCLNRCTDCLGTDSVVTKEALEAMKRANMPKTDGKRENVTRT